MKRYGIIPALGCLLLMACGGSGSAPADDSMSEVNIAVDETLQPIMEEELKVFNARFPDAILNERYVPETDALNLLLEDSLRLVLATRPLTESEQKSIWDVYQLKTRQQKVAYDAVALIQNRENPDSLITVGDVKRILNGTITTWKELGSSLKGNIEVVFDNSNSSLVRYVRDSICGGQDFKGIVKEGGDNRKVIEYVAQTPGALGIVSVDWLRNPADTSRLTFDPSIRVMSVSSSAVAEGGNSFQPFEYYIATGQYPWIRTIYMITTDPRQRSMGLNFYFFVSDEAGQLIITQSSQLLPIMPVHIRSVDVVD